MDSLPGSLSYVLDCITADDTVYFSPLIAGDTIVMSTESILVQENVTFLANPDDHITIVGNSSAPTIQVTPSGTLTAVGLHFVAGAGTQAAAVFNKGEVHFSDCEILSNPDCVSNVNLITNSGIMTIDDNCVIKECDGN